MKKWWTSVQSEYVLNAHHNLLLEAACGCWDRSTAAGKVLDAEGLTYTDDHGKIVRRPEISIERDNKIAFARLLRELDLDGAGSDDSRPPPIWSNRGRR
jgi:terminase small subunit-like protein